MSLKKSTYQQLTDLSQSIYTWNSMHYLLDWDQETYMPSEAVDIRTSQTALVLTSAHKLSTSRKFKKLLQALTDLPSGDIIDSTLSPAQKGAVRAWRQDYLKAAKLPSSFVKAFSIATTEASHAWIQARRESDFKRFAPYLEKIVHLSRRKADYFGYTTHPYDALLDLYEPEVTVETLSPIFQALQEELQELLRSISSRPQMDNHFLKQPFASATQFAFGKELMSAMGFRPGNSRLDLSAHPMCVPIHPHDIRMTTRIHENDLMSNIFSVIHEGGHGLYGQGLPLEFFGTPLCEQASLGIDESQSRFWETRIGRSRPFWHHFLPRLQAFFPELASISLDQFYAAINTIAPSLIRVEADEVTYSLHVILRFQIEKLLIEGSLKVKEIPELWNQKMKELLGVTPLSDAQGCLQDIHWSIGFFGYFPTYILGNLYASQFFDVFAKEHPDWAARVSSGDLAFITEWLKTHIHQWGRQFTPHELVQRITGKPLSEKPFLKHLREKYEKIYGF